MPKIQITLEPEALSPADMVSLQELTRCYLRDFLVIFAHNEKGEPINKWDALKHFDEFNVEELHQIMNELEPQLKSILDKQKE